MQALKEGAHRSAQPLIAVCRRVPHFLRRVVCRAATYAEYRISRISRMSVRICLRGSNIRSYQLQVAQLASSSSSSSSTAGLKQQHQQQHHHQQAATRQQQWYKDCINNTRAPRSHYSSVYAARNSATASMSAANKRARVCSKRLAQQATSAQQAERILRTNHAPRAAYEYRERIPLRRANLAALLYRKGS